MDLTECKKQGYIRKTAPNKSLIKSLIEMANSKELAVIDKETITA